MLDKFRLYELCAQAPSRDCKVLAAIHGGEGKSAPRILGEDFCGTAALSRAWVHLGGKHLAIAVDHDAATLAKAHHHARIGLIRADVMAVREPVDLIAVLNFSIGERRDRDALVQYLRHARSRLRAGGCFVCDIYGGGDAFLTGTIDQQVPAPDGSRITYSWEQRTSDPLHGRVTCAMHFRVRPAAGAKIGKRLPQSKSYALRDAFVYDWRLWSIAELRDAMSDAGFAEIEVFPRRPDAVDGQGQFHILPVEDSAELGNSYSVYVVGRWGHSRKRSLSIRRTTKP